MVEDALHEGEVYLLATQLHRNRVSSHQVAVDLSEDHWKPKPSAHVAAPAAGLLLNSEITHMTEMMEKLVAALAQLTVVGPTQRPQSSGAEQPWAKDKTTTAREPLAVCADAAGGPTRVI